MRHTDPPTRLPRFARRRSANTPSPGNCPGWAKALLDVLHKLLTAGAALATIVRVFL